MIPKIIHYCWLSNDPYPEDLVRCMNTWKEKLLDYEFKLWNFQNFDKSSSNWVSQAFDNKKYAFAADYIRLYAVYNYGGIYMDMDIEVLKSFDTLLDTNLLLAYENDEKNGIEAGCFGAEKNNPVIKECLDYYSGRNFIKEDGTFDILTLPKIMIQTTRKYPDLRIFDRYTFTCKSYQTGKIQTRNNSYAIHNFAGSWTSKAQQWYDKRRQFYCQHFGNKIGKVFSMPSFIAWQVHDNGFKAFWKKVSNKIQGKKK